VWCYSFVSIAKQSGGAIKGFVIEEERGEKGKWGGGAGLTSPFVSPVWGIINFPTTKNTQRLIFQFLIIKRLFKSMK